MVGVVVPFFEFDVVWFADSCEHVFEFVGDLVVDDFGSVFDTEYEVVVQVAD